jgi:hypothetical protein
VKPVTFTPERWYMVWNLSLVSLAMVGSALVFYWLGPIVIARGLERWSAMQK